VSGIRTVVVTTPEMLRDESVAAIHDLLRPIPAEKFIAFSAEGRTARGFELRPHQTDLGNPSPAGLVEFIGDCSTHFDRGTGPRSGLFSPLFFQPSVDG
jgi:hypothetical protein